MFAVVPGRTVATVAPSMRKFSVSPAVSSMNIKSGITIGVVTIVIACDQYVTPFFRISMRPGVPVMLPSTSSMNSIPYAPVSVTENPPVVGVNVTSDVLAL
jgi:hypothetical protein